MENHKRGRSRTPREEHGRNSKGATKLPKEETREATEEKLGESPKEEPKEPSIKETLLL